MPRVSTRLPLAATLVGICILAAASTVASAETATRSMAWDDCLSIKAEMQARLDIVPDKVIDIVASAALNVTRLCTSEGAIAISCSKATETLRVSVRPQQSELSCLWRSLVLTPS